jgi:hypothetical protein
MYPAHFKQGKSSVFLLSSSTTINSKGWRLAAEGASLPALTASVRISLETGLGSNWRIDLLVTIKSYKLILISPLPFSVSST